MASFRYLRTHRQTKTCSSQPDTFNAKLPPEVVSNIFVQSMTGGDGNCVTQSIPPAIPQASDGSLKEQHHNSVITPLQLGTVCRRWQYIAEKTPQLWTNLSIDISHDAFGQRHVLLFLRLIASSGGLPLRITLSVSEDHSVPLDLEENPDVRDMISAFLVSCSRAEALDIQLPEVLLQRVQWDPTDPARPAATQFTLCMVPVANPDGVDVSSTKLILGAAWDDLRHLELRGIRFEDVDIQWSNLTYLSVRRFMVCDALEVLHYAPKLEHFIVEEIDELPLDHDLSSDVIIHKGLRSFSMDPQIEEDASMFFENVRFPGLAELTLTLHDALEDTLDTILPTAFRNSLECLACLTLQEDIRITHDECPELIRVLKDLPSLEFCDLKLAPRDKVYYEMLFDSLDPVYGAMKSQKMLVPKLKELHLTLHGMALRSDDVPWECVPAIFTSVPDEEDDDYPMAGYRTPIVLRRPLRELHIKFLEHDPEGTISFSKPHLRKNAVLHLMPLMDAGVTFNISMDICTDHRRLLHTSYEILQSSIEKYGLSSATASDENMVLF